MKPRFLLLFISAAAAACAHEVPVHEAITRQAVRYLLTQLTAAEREQFGKCADEVLNKVLIGVAAEDNGYGNRFMFHFNPSLYDDYPVAAGFVDLHVESNCTSTDWAFSVYPFRPSGGAPLSQRCQHNQRLQFPDWYPANVLEVPRWLADAEKIKEHGDTDPDPDAVIDVGDPKWITMQNRHTWQAAVEAGRMTFVNDRIRGWIHLGYVLHLLQDLTSPAHTRGDAHPHTPLALGPRVNHNFLDPDALEFWEFLNQGANGQAVVPQLPAGRMAALVSPEKSAEELFEELRRWTQSRFFSKSTVFKTKTSAGEDLSGPRFAFLRDDGTVIGSASDDPNDRRAIAILKEGTPLASLRLRDTDAVIAERNGELDFDFMPATQFIELGRQAVNYTASLIYLYWKTVDGALPCKVERLCYTFSTRVEKVTGTLPPKLAEISPGQRLNGTEIFNPEHIMPFYVDLGPFQNGTHFFLESYSLVLGERRFVPLFPINGPSDFTPAAVVKLDRSSTKKDSFELISGPLIDEDEFPLNPFANPNPTRGGIVLSFEGNGPIFFDTSLPFPFPPLELFTKRTFKMSTTGGAAIEGTVELMGGGVCLQ